MTFRTDRMWMLRLLYAGINIEDDAVVYIRNSVLEILLSFYVSPLSDIDSKELILLVSCGHGNNFLFFWVFFGRHKLKTARFLLMDGIRDKVIAKFGDILVMVSETYRLLHADTLIRKCTNNKH